MTRYDRGKLTPGGTVLAPGAVEPPVRGAVPAPPPPAQRRAERR